jgi:hypothetical protein
MLRLYFLVRFTLSIRFRLARKIPSRPIRSNNNTLQTCVLRFESTGCHFENKYLQKCRVFLCLVTNIVVDLRGFVDWGS